MNQTCQIETVDALECRETTVLVCALQLSFANTQENVTDKATLYLEK